MTIYRVGGAVRDQLLGITPRDIDYVAVGAKPSDFSHLPLIGKSFPVYLTENGDELALARTERSNGSGHTDFEVSTENVTLEADLQRRDLSINSIAFSNDTYYDPFDGQSDIKNRILRHTSEAFSEDAVRVLRVARLRAKLGADWKIAPATKVLCYNLRHSLRELSSERIWLETNKALALPNPHIFFETLFELGVLEQYSPSLYELTTLKEGSKYHTESTVFVHTMMMLKASPTVHLLRLAILYHDIAKPYCYRTYGNSQDHDNPDLFVPKIDTFIPKSLRDRITPIITNHLRIFKVEEMTPQKTLKLLKHFYRKPLLFTTLLQLGNIDSTERLTDHKKALLPLKQLQSLYSEVFSYSPVDFIEEHSPSPLAIKDHVHRQRLNIIKRTTHELNNRHSS